MNITLRKQADYTNIKKEQGKTRKTGEECTKTKTIAWTLYHVMCQNCKIQKCGFKSTDKISYTKTIIFLILLKT